MDNKNSWFKMHRSIIDSNVFEDADVLKVWIWCLSKAYFAEADAITNKSIVHLKPGQFIYGRNRASAELGMNSTKCYRIMTKLEKIGNIEQLTNNRFTLVTVVKWAFFQGEEQKVNSKVNSQRTANEQPTNSQRTLYKNIKEYSKNNKEDLLGASPQKTFSTFVPPSVDEVADYCLKENLSIDPQKFIDFYAVTDWYRGKTKIKDWKACIRTWEQNNQLYDQTAKEERKKSRWQG